MSTALPPADDAIEVPTGYPPYAVGDGITVLPAYLPAPGMGILPAHAFVIEGPEPMLVDAGPTGAEPAFQQALAEVTDPAALRWLWLTHTDPDHVGSLRWLLDVAPDLKVVTTYLAVGKLALSGPLPMDRLLWVNPGTSVELNGRVLHAVRPPVFDAPETTAFFDTASRTLFSADAFGALVHRPSLDADEIDATDLLDGLRLWATVDAPWLTHTDEVALRRSIDALRRLDARRVLSSHLPPAHGLTGRLLDALSTVPGATPWTGPDQAALDALLENVDG